MNLFVALVVAFFPSWLKVRVLIALGHHVDRSAYIGLSLLNVKKISLGPSAYIGHGNLFTRLDELRIGEGGRINRWNRVTSGPEYHGTLVIHDRTSVSLRHYFDVCDVLEIGPDTIVAGHRSTFFTHSKGIDNIDFVKPIHIGAWCYIGSNVLVAPGTRLGSHNFVGMGAVLSGNKEDVRYSLLVGNPASVKRPLDPNAGYFTQGPLRHPHMQVDDRDILDL